MKASDDFEIGSKRNIKIEKTSLKNHLRNHYIPKLHVQSSEHSDDDQANLKTLAKGSYWWTKTDTRFFRTISTHELAILKSKATTCELLQCKYRPNKLSSFAREKTAKFNLALLNESFVKVLFRREVKMSSSQNYELVVYQFKAYDEPQHQDLGLWPNNLHLLSFRYNSWKNIHPIDNQAEYLGLESVAFEKSQQNINHLLRMEVNKKQSPHEIDREIILGEEELINAHESNLMNWSLLEERMKRKVNNASINYEDEVGELWKELRMAEVLLHFRLGHRDKTEEMLEDAMDLTLIKEMSMKEEQRKKKNTKMEKMKCLFETDCKICFCTESDDQNRVIYCDHCNTSFHQACYGITEIALEKKFYCEVCVLIRNAEEGVNGAKMRKPICQICSKANFPMKNLENHFYHMTCLVLFNCISFASYEITFKQGLTPQQLAEFVVQNQIQSEDCHFCLKACGMKFKCSLPGCPCYFHPICAYLHGYHFDLVRSFSSLTVNITCSEHFSDRNCITQTYYRRFFCDYKNTSNLSEEDFKQSFHREVLERSENHSREKYGSIGSILKMGKPAKIYIYRAKQAKMERLKEKAEGSAKKELINASTEENIAQMDDEMTETRKLLNKMSEQSKSE